MGSVVPCCERLESVPASSICSVRGSNPQTLIDDAAVAVGWSRKPAYTRQSEEESLGYYSGSMIDAVKVYLIHAHRAFIACG